MNFSFFFFFLVSLFSIPFLALKKNCTKGWGESSKSIYLFLKKKEKEEDGWIIKRNYYWKNDLIQMKSCGVYIYIYIVEYFERCVVNGKPCWLHYAINRQWKAVCSKGQKGKRGTSWYVLSLSRASFLRRSSTTILVHKRKVVGRE